MVIDPATRADRVDGEIAALGDQRHAAGHERLDRVAPERCQPCNGDDAVAVGPADRQPAVQSAFAQLPLELHPRLDLPEPRGEHDRPSAAALDRVADRRRHAGRRDRNDHRVNGLGQLQQAGKALAPMHLRALRVHPPNRPLKPPALEITKGHVPIGPSPVVGADNGNGARREEWGGVQSHNHLKGSDPLTVALPA